MHVQVMLKLIDMKRKIGLKFIKGACLSIIMCFLIPVLRGQTDPSNPLPQFLFPSFTKSLVKMKDGRQLTASINYNMVDEEMIFDQKGVYMALDKPQEIDTIYLQNKKFVPVEKAFYEVLNKGEITMFIQHKSKYSQKGTPTAYGMTTKTAGPTKVLSMRVGNQVRQVDLPENVEITAATVYWVKYNNGMNKFTTEKQFLKLFPDKADKLKEYIKNSKLNLKEREDLIKLGNFCNEIIK
jgi:hypothetical protein